jgi:hypothetical protein
MLTCSNEAGSTVLRRDGSNAAEDPGTVFVMTLQMCVDNTSWQAIVGEVDA